MASRVSKPLFKPSPSHNHNNNNNNAATLALAVSHSFTGRLAFVTFLKALFNRSTKTRIKYVADRHAWSFHGVKLLHKVQSLKWHSIVVFVNGYSIASSCKLHLLTNRRPNGRQRQEGFVLQCVREYALGSANHPIPIIMTFIIHLHFVSLFFHRPALSIITFACYIPFVITVIM